MGEAEIDLASAVLRIRAHIVTYGNAADEETTLRMCAEISSMWNEPEVLVHVGGHMVSVAFLITGELRRNIDPYDVVSNTDPTMNFFRIEDRSVHNISFVDGLGCNSGYFQQDNLYEGSTTAAHEFGHTIGLDHPFDLDIRGYGVPGIMYPRGTLVDPPYQYDPNIMAGLPGGTMHPKFRRVKPEDIWALQLDKLRYRKGKAILGAFSNVYHQAH